MGTFSYMDHAQPNLSRLTVEPLYLLHAAFLWLVRVRIMVTHKGCHCKQGLKQLKFNNFKVNLSLKDILLMGDLFNDLIK